jgi:hypothetical protein
MDKYRQEARRLIEAQMAERPVRHPKAGTNMDFDATITIDRNRLPRVYESPRALEGDLSGELGGDKLDMVHVQAWTDYSDDRVVVTLQGTALSSAVYDEDDVINNVAEELFWRLDSYGIKQPESIDVEVD